MSLTASTASHAPSTPPYPHLSTPTTVGPLQLPHRVIMGSMHLGLEDDHRDFDRLAAFYAERVRGGAGLVITGGFSPNSAGRLTPDGAVLATEDDAAAHRTITEAVHQAGGAIAAQILHAGRYAYHPHPVSASATQAPINRFAATEISTAEVGATVSDFVQATVLAADAGYDAIEIMGSEGYLINQFLSAATNRRDDVWGGSSENRRRFAVEIARGVAEAVGDRLAVIFRLSMVDLVTEGQTADEVLALARELEDAGVVLLNTGVGWHESRVPTIVTSVPRAVFSEFTARVRREVSIPVAVSNRINMPETAEQLLADDVADMVTMARPFLADADWVNKMLAGDSETINTCIGCNQACLDHSFTGRNASCLVNPRAGREIDLIIAPTTRPGARVAVVGGGPAGMNAAIVAAQRGFDVELFESGEHLGGQFRLARAIPGKEEFAEALRYFRVMLDRMKVQVHLNQHATAGDLTEFDDVIIATGVKPRIPNIPGIDHPRVHSYSSVVAGEVECGDEVAVLGAGGIGFDVSELMIHGSPQQEKLNSLPTDQQQSEWFDAWGVDPQFSTPGAVRKPAPPRPARRVHLLQRKTTKLGADLAPTTGWVHRTALRAGDVQFVQGVAYEKIDDEGLHITVDGESVVLAVDDIVVCTGQESVRDVADELTVAGVTPHVIGGADVAAELDAKRAIEQATRVVAELP